MRKIFFLQWEIFPPTQNRPQARFSDSRKLHISAPILVKNSVKSTTKPRECVENGAWFDWQSCSPGPDVSNDTIISTLFFPTPGTENVKFTRLGTIRRQAATENGGNTPRRRFGSENSGKRIFSDRAPHRNIPKPPQIEFSALNGTCCKNFQQKIRILKRPCFFSAFCRVFAL